MNEFKKMNHIRIFISLFLISVISNSTNAQNIISEFNDIIVSKLPENIDIISLGDPTHQESTITKHRIDLVKKLVEGKKFEIIAIEGNIYELYKAHQKLIENDDISYLENAMYSQLNIAEMEELYQYVFEKNRNGDSIIITGFDPVFSGNTFVQNIKSDLKNIDFLTESEKKDFVNELEKATNTKFTALFRNNKKVKSKIIQYSNIILNKFNPESESDYYFEQALKNIVFLYDSKQTENRDNLRDIGMSENIFFLNKIYNNKKIILFGSSTHLIKNPQEINSNFFQNNRKTLGDLLNQNFPEKYHFIAYSGISGEKSNIFNKPKKLPELNENSIEFNYKDIDSYIFLNESNSNEENVYSRFLGHSFVKINIWNVMDGLVLIKNISPAKIKKL